MLRLINPFVFLNLKNVIKELYFFYIFKRDLKIYNYAKNTIGK